MLMSAYCRRGTVADGCLDIRSRELLHSATETDQGLRHLLPDYELPHGGDAEAQAGGLCVGIHGRGETRTCGGHGRRSMSC